MQMVVSNSRKCIDIIAVLKNMTPELHIIYSTACDFQKSKII